MKKELYLLALIAAFVVLVNIFEPRAENYKLTTEWAGYYIGGEWKPKANVMEQKYIELGLRSDGVVVWRKKEK